MASGSNVAVEYENWMRMLTFVHYGGKELCLDVIHRQEGLPTDGGQLYSALAAKITDFQKLLHKGVLKQNQYDIIFPPNRITDTSQFDITLYTLVISVMFGKKYQKVIDELRKWRNTEFHKGNISFTNAQFSTQWIDFSTFLQNHGFNVFQFNNLKTCPLDANSQYRNAHLEAEILKYDIEISVTKQYVASTKQDVEATKQGLAATKQDVAATKQDVAATKQDIAATKQDVASAKQDVAATKQDVAATKQDVAATKQDVAATKQDVAATKQDVAATKQDVAATKQDVVVTKQDVAATKQDVVAITKDVRSLKDQFTTAAEMSAGKYKGTCWNVRESVSNFFGRKEVLEEIYAKITTTTNYNYNAVAVSGFGGIGKSQVAAKYAELHRKKDYDVVMWLNASNLEQSMLSLLKYFGISVEGDASLEYLTQTLCMSLNSWRCLIIVDDVETPKSLFPILKNLQMSIKPAVLITTQFERWDQKKIQQVKMEVFGVDEARSFLHEELPNSSKEDIAELATTLQSLPLAMQQAVCYINVNIMPVRSYLQYFEESRKEILDINLEEYSIDEYDKTLLTVWNLAYNKIKTNEKAMEVIGMMVYMDPNYINKNTFLYHEGIYDELVLNDVLKIICEYSLVSKSSSTFLYMHPLIQKVIKVLHTEQGIVNYKAFLAVMIKKIVPDLANENLWLETDEENLWLPHAVINPDLLKGEELQAFHIIYYFNRSVPVKTALNSELSRMEKFLPCLTDSNMRYRLFISWVESLTAKREEHRVKEVIDMFEKNDDFKHIDSFSMHLWWLKKLYVFCSFGGKRSEAEIQYNSLNSMESLFNLSNDDLFTLYETKISILTYIRNIEEAVAFCLKALELSASGKKQLWILKELVRCYGQLQNYLKVSFYMNELKKMIEKLKIPQNHSEYQLYELHKVNLLILEGQFDKAGNTAQQLVEFWKGKNYAVVFKSKLILAKVFLNQGMYKNCEELMTTILSNIEKDIVLYDMISVAWVIMVFVKFILSKYKDVMEIMKMERFNALNRLKEGLLARIKDFIFLFNNMQMKKQNSQVHFNEINDIAARCVEMKAVLKGDIITRINWNFII